jgi:hypothetical protein
MATGAALGPDSPPKTSSRRRLGIVLGLAFLALSVLALCFFGWKYRDNNRVINYAVALIPVALSIVIAFVPDLRRAHMAWRIAIVALGLLWSVLLWRQQVLTDKEQSETLGRVVSNTRELVKEDLKKAADHSDQQISSIRTDLHNGEKHSDQQIVAVTGLISQTTNDLSKKISKVNKPDPPERPKLKFSLWGGDGKPYVAYAIKPDKEGTFAADVYFTNVAQAAASKIDVWIYICDDCIFVKEPSGFDKPNGMEETERHRLIMHLNPGTSFEKTTLHVKLKKPVPWFDIAF